MEIVFNKLCYIENPKSSSEKKYLEDINLVIKQGSIVGFLNDDLSIIGKLIMAIKRPTKGELRIDDMIIKRTSHVTNVNELRKKVGFVYTSSDEFIGKTVKEEIKQTMKNFGYKASNVTKHVVDSLKIVGISEDYLDRDPNTLSYTEKKKLKLASAMSYNPSVLVLEDFDKGLLFKEREYFRKLFLKLKNKFNKTIILITKDLTAMFDLVDKMHVINKGKLVISGGKEIFYDDKLYKYVEMPKIVEFTKYAQECGHNILEYTDIKELIKELYRNVQ
ncbi:MAG: ATP-binding cassette domain-containing protein [Firmicutes bacterium]|nr:ATP-binding cassette domain-containing protein [Bacillota bacterium]